MTYKDIITPIRKVNYGEADIIFTFLSATNGRIESIAKGIRKSTSRKRGNIDYGFFSSGQFAKGKNLDVLTEVQMLEYNEELLTAEGLGFLREIMPLLNRFSTDKLHSIKNFDTVKDVFMNFESENRIYFETKIKYELLDIQDLLPEWNQCSMCKLKFENLDKYSIKSSFPLCNNCARKVESKSVNYPRSVNDLISLAPGENKIILTVMNNQIRNVT